MPRREPSAAERELAIAVSDRGRRVTPRQLERWRTYGLLPRLPRKALGRGAGSRSWVTDELVARACAVADAVATTKSLDQAALALFVKSEPVPEAVVRRAYRSTLEAMVADIEARERPGDSVADTLDRFARQIARRPSGDAIARCRERLRQSRPREKLSDATYAALTALVTGRPSTHEGLATMAAAVGADAMTTERIGLVGPVLDEIDWTGVEASIKESDVFSLLRRTDGVAWPDLCAARDFLADLQDVVVALLVPAGHAGAPDALGLREMALQTDLQIALNALAVAPFVGRHAEDVARWRALRREIPRLHAVASFLDSLPAHLRAKVALADADPLAELDATERADLKALTLRWVAENPAHAAALDEE